MSARSILMRGCHVVIVFDVSLHNYLLQGGVVRKDERILPPRRITLLDITVTDENCAITNSLYVRKLFT